MFEVWLQMSDTNIDRENPSDLPALLSTANTFAIPGFRKMVHFSTSQANIAYEK